MRLTVMLGANANGSEKLPPFVIGKSKRPRYFKNVKSLPVNYDSNKKAWMTSEFFREQLATLDAKMGAQKRKILLFIDRCPAHPIDMHLRNIQVEFLPANCTSKLQPLDLGIIHSFKSLYRKKLVQRILDMMDGGKYTSSYKISVLDALHFIAKAWKEVKETSISNCTCFLKAGFFKNPENGHLRDEEEDESLLPSAWKRLKPSCCIQDFLEMDETVITTEEIAVEDVVAEPTVADSDDISDDEDDDEIDNDPEFANAVPTSAEVSSAVEIIRKYLSSVDGNEKKIR